MKLDVKMGLNYWARVSGKLVIVVPFFGPSTPGPTNNYKVFFRCTNLRTGRILELGPERMRAVATEEQVQEALHGAARARA